MSSKRSLIFLVMRCWTRCLTSLDLSFGGAGFELEGVPSKSVTCTQERKLKKT